MEFSTPEARTFLFELCTMAAGDTSTRISMYEVGTAVGLTRPEAEAIVQELAVESQVELMSLSGAISITQAGLAALEMAAPVAAGDAVVLGGDIVLQQEVRRVVEKLCSEIKAALPGKIHEYPLLEEIVIDLKTIEVQLLSPRPKTEVIRSQLLCLAASCRSAGLGPLAERLTAISG